MSFVLHYFQVTCYSERNDRRGEGSRWRVAWNERLCTAKRTRATGASGRLVRDIIGTCSEVLIGPCYCQDHYSATSLSYPLPDLLLRGG